MGIRKSIKKRLPIVGSSATPPAEQGPDAQGGTAPAWVDEPKAEGGREGTDVQSWIDGLVKSNKLVLFMKGSPHSPMCGFSANASAVLMSYGVPIKHVDVLQDPEVRQGIKDYSQWPTIPQVYVDGEFRGGSDILMQMHDSGDLGKMLIADAE